MVAIRHVLAWKRQEKIPTVICSSQASEAYLADLQTLLDHTHMFFETGSS